VALADLDQPAPDVLAVQLGRSHLGMVLGQPPSQAPHRVLVGLDGVVGVPVGPQRQFPRHGDHGDVRMAPAHRDRDIERDASSSRRHHRHVFAVQQVRELGGVGNRLVPVAIVYARPSAALTCVFPGRSRAFRRSYRDTGRALELVDAGDLADREARRAAAQILSDLWTGVSSPE
jgi:hypothetical protein